jgi:hypothetical protein
VDWLSSARRTKVPEIIRFQIDSVRYDELAPMLLNEVQQQAAEIRDLKR